VADQPDNAPVKPETASKALGNTGPRDIPRWRRIVAAVLLVVGVLLVPLSLSAIWVRNTLLDTDQYVSTIGPLAGNSEIQQGLADRVTTALFADGNVEKKIAEALPPRADVLAAPISSGLEGVADRAALRLFQSDRFQTVWENVNRRAHTAVVKVLTGGGSRVSTNDGTVSVNIEQIFTNVKKRLDARGITVFDDAQLPAKYQSVVLIQSKQLEEAQGFVDLLQKMAWVLPVIALVCIGGAIALSRDRRRRIMRAGIWVAVAVALQLALLSVGRNFYLEAITNSGVRKGSAGAVWDQLTSFLRQSGTTVIVLALVIAIAAWIAGPSRLATRIRGLWTNALGGRSDVEAGPVATFVARSKTPLRVAGAGVALAILILWNHPKPVTVLGVGILLLVYLAVIELLGRGASAPAGAEEV
jgi:hypothetical protein